MGAGGVLCDDVLRRRMRTCVLSVSSTVGRSVCRSRHYVSALWCRDKKHLQYKVFRPKTIPYLVVVESDRPGPHDCNILVAKINHC